MAEVNLWPVWKRLGLSALQRTEHVQACLLCKAVIDQCALTDNEEYMVEAAEFLHKHADVPPEKNVSAAPPCRFADCIHHEDVSHEVGMAILKVHSDGKPWRDNKGVPVGMAPILASPKDKPPGFEIGKDANHRGQGEEPIAAEVYVRLGQKKTTIHLWMTPAFASRHEDSMEAVGVWELKRIYEEHVTGYREWVMAKWVEIKALAEMEVNAEKPPVEPKRKRKKAK